MEKKKRKQSLIKPIILMLLQIFSLYVIFTILSMPDGAYTNHTSSVFAICMIYILLSSIVIFSMLDSLKEEEKSSIFTSEKSNLFSVSHQR
jgi:multisubunit Na+/H+ antiporter MnhB subunit